MGSLSTDVAARALRFFGLKPGDQVDPERREEVRQVMWWMVESDAAKAKRHIPRKLAIGDALRPPESQIEVLLGVAMAHVPSLAGQFIPQHTVGPYRLDFGFHAVKLGIECDGAEFHREPSQILRDQRRDAFLSKLGWKVIRFTGREIRRSAAECVARIARYYEALKVL